MVVGGLGWQKMGVSAYAHMLRNTLLNWQIHKFFIGAEIFAKMFLTNVGKSKKPHV